MRNPFENTETPYLVLTNAEAQHSLWPAHIATPSGWTRVHGPDGRDECTSYVERNWTDLRPMSLRRA
ncbi:MbtH family protein [Allokutzneria albata]|uniref:MbtH protein n=1 Tax=Allokutzneria albata TaxID=211114 RepID=A0A1G9SGZ4_ALLAB|nr:MbtH family protein [Allokutzneria albata]SDM34577.1 MbtH protein [Allokutzneria albata]